MAFPDGLIATPWDRRVFNFPTWEITKLEEDTLIDLGKHPGHYTAKVDPLSDKGLLHRHGFFYCDTLMEPFANRRRFVDFVEKTVTIERNPNREGILNMAQTAFRHGRFHRDFNLEPTLADRRYCQWLEELLDEGNCYGVNFKTKPAAFICCRGNKLVLHAVAKEFQGRGLAKFFWSSVIRDLFSQGHEELCSSVSASNSAILNLYATLGFRFRNPVDIYHRFVP